MEWLIVNSKPFESEAITKIHTVIYDQLFKTGQVLVWKSQNRSEDHGWLKSPPLDNMEATTKFSPEYRDGIS